MMHRLIDIHVAQHASQPDALAYALTQLLPGAHMVVVPPGGNWIAAHVEWENSHRTGAVVIDGAIRTYRIYTDGAYQESTYDALEAASILSRHIRRPGWRQWLADRLQASHNRETAVQLAARLTQP